MFSDIVGWLRSTKLLIPSRRSSRNPHDIPIAVMIGGMRCGTRAFLKYLRQHPAVLPHKTAHDPHFFSKDENWSLGVESYLEGWKEFNYDKHRIAFESSTHYTKYPSILNVPERMKASGLNFYFIFSARDPIKRIESHLVHNVGKGYFNASDHDARGRFLRFALNYSKYGMQLDRYLSLFPQERLHVFALEQLSSDYSAVMANVCKFLQIDPSHRFKKVPTVGTKFVTSVDHVGLTQEEVEWLRSELRDDVSAFLDYFQLTDDDWPLYRGKEDRLPSGRMLSQATTLRGETIEPQRRPDVRPPEEGPAIQNLRCKDGDAPWLSQEAQFACNTQEHSAPAIVKGARYAMLTVDTEALPRRAPYDHVRRLIWGEHDKGTAGIRELCAITCSVGGKLVFFVDACETYFYGDEIREVVRWLHEAGQDVQLHAHPEQLPEQFWSEHGFQYNPRFLNEYDNDKAQFTISHFSRIISDVTGVPVLGFRAGSFRWNASTIRALHAAGIPVSFNNRVHAHLTRKCCYSEATHLPYEWENGVVEVPLTETRKSAAGNWISFKFPISLKSANSPQQVFDPFVKNNDLRFLVLLLHSWSLLYWDENGYGVYQDDQRIEEYEQLVQRIAKDYDIITTPEFLELKEKGKITPTHSVPLSQAE